MKKCCRSSESFEIKEKGKTNRLILNGFWIWWCYEHNQPIAWCEIDALKAALKVHREIGDEAENEVLQLQTKDKMKNTDIAKIRKILTELKYCEENHIIFNFGNKVISLAEINEALALLPCETCGGSGRMAKYNQAGDLVVGDPCPDCQPKLCVCCEEITEKNAHLHRNCGK